MWQFYAISQIGVDAKGLVIDDQITRAHERAVEFCNCYLTFFFLSCLMNLCRNTTPLEVRPIYNGLMNSGSIYADIMNSLSAWKSKW